MKKIDLKNYIIGLFYTNVDGISFINNQETGEKAIIFSDDLISFIDKHFELNTKHELIPNNNQQ